MFDDTIIAVITPAGMGAVGVVRLSGDKAISITNSLFKGKDLLQQASHTIHFGTIQHNGHLIDEVLVSLFKAPHSYTKEDVVEISGHGSPFIMQQLMQVFIEAGARPAKAGEFTMRAFLNGRFDLSQAEAVADVIASDNASAHDIALKQMRGGFSNDIKQLRSQLIHLASLLELELDFGEEDVEFASREQLLALVSQLQKHIAALLESFSYGNVIKNGVSTVIAGRPNAGKSTLLNALLNEERAIVSDIAGTTRDTIEETLVIEGISFRLIDTAGLREATDTLEHIGIEKTKEKIQQSSVIVYLYDVNTLTTQEAQQDIAQLNAGNTPVITVSNKAEGFKITDKEGGVLYISAKERSGIDALKKALVDTVLQGGVPVQDTIITNARHYDALQKTQQALYAVTEGLHAHMSKDLVAANIRHALYHLGLITGEITTDDLLENIFSKFCIGK